LGIEKTMNDKLTKEELVRLVERIQNAEGTEEEIDAMIDRLQANVPHPTVSDLIFYPEEEMTAEQVVEVALAYATPQIGSQLKRDRKGQA
jgi:hypothetical protein